MSSQAQYRRATLTLRCDGGPDLTVEVASCGDRAQFLLEHPNGELELVHGSLPEVAEHLGGYLLSLVTD